MLSVVVLDVVGSKAPWPHLRLSPRTAVKYSNPYALRLPWASIYLHARLHRLTVSSAAPVVCVQKARGSSPLSSTPGQKALPITEAAKDGAERGKACRIATHRCRSAFCATDLAMRLSRGSLVEVNAPRLPLRHDTPDNDRATGALPVQVRVGPGSGGDRPVAGGSYGAVRL